MYTLKGTIQFFDIFVNYMTLQLVRCAIVSILIMGMILLIRLFCEKTTFLKGLLWCLLLLAPLFGRLRVYYELNALSIISWKWVNWCMNYKWISRIYFSGIFIMAGKTVINRHKLNCLVKKMDKTQISGTSVYVCPVSITPFTTGVFKHKIVIPKCMIDGYSKDELESVLLHEKTHIYLKHMVLFMMWDILHIILWINPMFTVCLKYFRQDMEDICDAVTIQKSGCDGYKYGSLLIRSMEILQDKTDADGDRLLKVNIPVTFTGESRFMQMKQRIIRVVRFKKYNKAAACFMACFAIFATVIFAEIIHTHSYARYENDDRIMVFNRTGEEFRLNDLRQVKDIVSYDKDYIYVNTNKFKSVLDADGIPMQTFVISFGGYRKLPGYGGGGYCEFLEPEMLMDGIAKVPYVSRQSVLTYIFKYI